MKKKISVLSLAPSLLFCLAELSRQLSAKLPEAEEFAAELSMLSAGESHGLLLQSAQDSGASDSSSVQVSLSPADRPIICDGLQISPRARTVFMNGAEISLTPKEFDILLFLVRNRGQVFTKEQIYQAVWEEDYLMDDSNIMAFIRKLRKKIEPNPDAPEYILTVWGIGYKFKA